MSAVHAAPHTVHTHNNLNTHVVTTLQNSQRCMFTDHFYKFLTLARFSVSSLRMIQVDRNM